MSFLTSIFGGGGGAVPPGVSKDQTNTATGTLGTTGTTGANFAKSYGDTGATAINSGLNHLQPAANWFQTLINGNRQATLAQLQPDIQQAEQGQKTALQTASILAPRGGGRGEALFNQPFAAQKQIASGFQTARGAAPAALQSTGTAEGAIGSAAAGAGAGFGGVGTQANNSLLNYGLNQQQQSYTQAQQNGGLFGKLIAPLVSTLIPGVGGLISSGIGALGKKFANAGGGADNGGTDF